MVSVLRGTDAVMRSIVEDTADVGPTLTRWPQEDVVVISEV